MQVRSFLAKSKPYVLDPHPWILVFSLAILAILYSSWPWVEFGYWFWRFAVMEYTNHIVGSTFLLPMAYSAMVFRWRGTLVVWGLSMAITLPHVIRNSPNTESLLSNMVFLQFPALIIALVTLAMKWRERERKNMEEREVERKAYLTQILKVQEEERMRIAQELHDDITQTLLAVANSAQDLVSISREWPNPKAETGAKWIRDVVLEVSDDVRRLSLSLRPRILDNIGLMPALRWLADELRKESKIDPRVVIRGAERKLPSEVEINIFRIVQEALNNVRRHSGASEARIYFDFRADSVNIKIEDNGSGFSPRRIRNRLGIAGRLGLIGMEQRAQTINGRLQIRSRAGKGTAIILDVSC